MATHINIGELQNYFYGLFHIIYCTQPVTDVNGQGAGSKLKYRLPNDFVFCRILLYNVKIKKGKKIWLDINIINVGKL